MMYVLRCDRRRILDLLVGGTEQNGLIAQACDSTRGLMPEGDETILVWRTLEESHSTLPSAILVAEGRATDFIAWASTYLRHIRPFTAYCRVLTPAMLNACDSEKRSPLPPDLELAIIGLCISEGISHAIGRADVGRLSLAAFSRTLSYAIAECLKVRGWNGLAAFQDISAGWQSARELTHQVPLELSPSVICAVWTTFLSVFDTGKSKATTRSDVLVRALQEVRTNGVISKASWNELLIHFSAGDALLKALDGPREQRVAAVEAALPALAQGADSSRMERSFIAGYVASRIQPGSLEHFPILCASDAALKGTILWYGVCAGLNPSSAVAAYGNGLGRLIWRELQRTGHWLDRPDSDISVAELKLLLTGRERAKPVFPIVSGGVLSVELLPLVTTRVRWPDLAVDASIERPGSAEGAHQKSTFSEASSQRDEDVREILRRVSDSAKSIDLIRQLAEKSLGEGLPHKRRRRK